MRWSSWLGLWQSRSPRTPARRPRQPAACRRMVRPRLHLERLEDRTVPSTVTWINPAGGDWSVAGNWYDATTMTNHVPGATDDAVINLGANNFTVTHSTGLDSVHSLTDQSAFNLSGGSLAFTLNGVINAAFSFSGATIAGGTLVSGAAASLAGNAYLANGATWESDGTLTLADQAFLQRG